MARLMPKRNGRKFVCKMTNKTVCKTDCKTDKMSGLRKYTEDKNLSGLRNYIEDKQLNVTFTMNQKPCVRIEREED